ncbi:MAG: APC family permease, partial [Thermomicrobiales bacterium]
MADLRRTLGLATLGFYGIGVIIGAGIYSVIGPAAGVAGDALWQAFVLAGVAAALSALSYAELAAMFPHAGAIYVYLRAAWPRLGWLPGTAGWVLIFTSIAGTAAIARAFAGYATRFLPGPEGLIAVGFIAAVVAIALAGMAWTSRANILLTIIEIAGLIAIIAVGIAAPDFGRALSAPPHPGVIDAAGLVFFAFLGFESLANLAEDARDPQRDLPRAMFIAVSVTTVLY